MWTPATRAQHTRVAKRYQTDLSDLEWRLIAAFLPAARSTGRRREWPMREIVNVIFYVLRGGIAWRLLPKVVVLILVSGFRYCTLKTNGPLHDLLTVRRLWPQPKALKGVIDSLRKPIAGLVSYREKQEALPRNVL